ncbi:MAG: hypothetical protein HQ594_07405, partial [Candidatus Omnitrophica bacterium]|nr:hypothetical protein [Candidatus Omnitrophota bacterium]
LFAISGEAEILTIRKNVDREIKDAARSIREQTERIKLIVAKLMEFSRAAGEAFSAIDINQAIQKVYGLLKYQIKLGNVIVNFKMDDNIPKTFGNYNQLQEVFLNIMLNSVQSMGEKGQLTVRTFRETAAKPYAGFGRVEIKKGDELVVAEFKDTGKGMDTETLNKIFNPFFSTKEKGTGLGLAIVYKIIENHEGVILVDSKPGEGTIFTVKLPVFKGGKNVQKDSSDR